MASQVENIKWVPGTRFIVDGFAFTSPQCQQYFLTHCHSDHTIGLTRRFTAGTIWCSPVSAKLLAAEWNLRAPTVRQLELHTPVVIDGVTVTALDANHCPGAIMLLFEVPAGPSGAVKRVLHTGDCRWQDRLYSSSCLRHKPIDTLMLDTTYALPKHTFPPQEEAISMMAQLMREALQDEPETLLVVSSYHIGKERAYLGAAAALGLQVYVPAAKLRVLQLLDLPPHLMGVVCSDPRAQIHVGCTSLAPDELQAYLAKQQQQQGSRAWARIMGFRATGWSYRRSGGTHVQRPSDTGSLVGVPYSEHSSWHDLRACVARLRPKRLIPTVNAATRAQQEALVDRFADLMDLSANRGRMDAYLVRRPHAAAAGAWSHAADAGGAGPDAAHAASAGASSHAAAAAAEAAAAAPWTAAAVSAAGAGGSVLCIDVDAYSAPSTGPCSSDQQLWAEDPPMLVDSRGLSKEGSSAVWQLDPDTLQGDLQQPSDQPQPAQEQQNHLEAPASGELHQDFDLTCVDMAEQQRLLEDFERRQRLKKSLGIQATSRRTQHKGRRNSKGCPGSLGPTKRPGILKKDAKQSRKGL